MYRCNVHKTRDSWPFVREAPHNMYTTSAAPDHLQNIAAMQMTEVAL